jgi:beta-barrel assembly-enhancing protease
MFRTDYRRIQRSITWLALAAMVMLPLSASAQTKISYHGNKFKPEDDVRLGRQAAQEAERQMPILRDREATDYLSTVGQRLVAAIPPEFQHPEFNYYFKIVNVSDINAFALPGGPMYVNRGTILAAHNEGELAGVMAHELSHVALRHGTAQATKAQKYSVLAGVLGVGGAIVGGPLGAAAQVGAQGVGVYFLKFSREYETEADVLGAQIMARAGYNPLDLANMFKTIERTSGGSGGGFLSDHPSPANRYQRINQEAQYLRVTNPIGYSKDFERIKSRLGGLPRAQTTAEVARAGQRYPADNDDARYPDTSDSDRRYPNDERNGNRDNDRSSDRNSESHYPDARPTGRVSLPSSRNKTYSEFGFLRLSVPDNWREQKEDNSVWFVPEGASGEIKGQPVFTHGINFSVSPGQGQELETATNEAVRGLLQNNPNMRQLDRYNHATVNGRPWVSTRFSNRNEATGRTETVAFFATKLRNGNILYISTVVPEGDPGEFQSAFTRIMNSVQLSD